MDIGNEMRVIEVDEPAVAPKEVEKVEEIRVEETTADSPTPARK